MDGTVIRGGFGGDSGVIRRMTSHDSEPTLASVAAFARCVSLSPMPPRKRKAAAPAGVDEQPALDVAPASAADDVEQLPSEGGATTAGPGDAPAPAAVATEAAGTGGDAPCVSADVSGDEEAPEVQGGQGAPHAQPGGEDGGVTSAEAPHAAPVASSVRPCVSACADPRSCFLAGTQPCPGLAHPRAHTSGRLSAPRSCPQPDAHTCVCPPVQEEPQEWELAPSVPAECILSPAFRLSQLPDGTTVDEVRGTRRERAMHAHPALCHHHQTSRMPGFSTVLRLP